MIRLPRVLGPAALCVSAVAVLPAQVVWNGDPDRYGHAAAFDPTLLRVVTFGGAATGAQLLGDTRSYGAGGFTRLFPANSPAARAGVAMAGDLSGLVAFGGIIAGGLVSAETWLYDGNDWNLRTEPVSPAARVGHRMAYDEIRDRIVLFGGWSPAGVPLPELWEWSATTGWLQRTVANLPPVRDHAMCYQSGNARRIVINGGAAPGGLQAGTWTWDGTTWTSYATATPGGVARYDHAMASDEHGHVYLYGGRVGFGADLLVGLSETWSLSPGNAWTAPVGLDSPDAYGRFGHSMTWDRSRNVFVVYGGRAGGEVAGTPGTIAAQFGSLLADVIEWDPHGVGDWESPAAVAAPAARMFAGVASEPATGRILMVGGSRVAPAFESPPAVDATSDAWFLQDLAWVPAGFSGNLPPRSRHALCWDRRQDRFVVFGGIAPDGTLLGDTRTCRATPGSGWIQATAGSLTPRQWPAMVSTPGGLLCYGGLQTTTGLDDCYWNTGSTWTRLSTAALGRGRAWHAMAYDSRRDRVVLYGGRSTNFQVQFPTADPLCAETWEWDGAVWTLRTPAHQPPPLVLHAMAYDEYRDRVVLFGGVDDVGAYRNETWEWDGSDWVSRVVPRPPVGRYGHGLVYDHDTQRIVAVAGNAAGLLVVEPWEYKTTIPATATSSGTPCPVGASAPSLRTAAGQMLWLGDTVQVQFGNLPAGALAFVVIGHTTSLFDLGAIGLPGCTQYLQIVGQAFLGLPVNQVATWNEVVSTNPFFLGLTLHYQGFALQAGGSNHLGAVVSDLLQLTIGQR